MAHDVFISYHHDDQPFADAVCGGLETAGVPCWMAPRDILPSMDWSEAIINAIAESRLVVLVFSAKANDSKQVLREIDRAVNRRLPILPFRITEHAATGAMEYLLAPTHWLDAFTHPIDHHVRELVRSVQVIVHTARSKTTTTAPPEPIARVASSTRPNAGRLVSKTCDRWSQVNAFDAFLRDNRRKYPGRPQLFVIHGEDGQGHDSLLDRLAATTISRFAEDVEGQERGSILRLTAPWPDADDPLIARRDLVISLFREADPRYLDDDLSAAALARRVAAHLGRVTVIHHDIRVRRWRRHTAALIDWYANDFWNSLPPSRTGPQFLVFLKVIYPSTDSSGILGNLLGTAGHPRRRVQQALAAIPSDPERCSIMIFRELQSVTVDDVKDWFNKNHIYDSEHQRHALARAIFKGGGSRRMVDVEPALAEIHDAALAVAVTRETFI